MSLSSNEILLGNAIVYTLTLLIYYIKSKSFNVGVLLLSLYTAAAWASLGFFNHPWFYFSVSYSHMTIEPFIYLYIALMLFMYSFLKVKSNTISTIVQPSVSKLLPLIKVLTIILIIHTSLILTTLPSLMRQDLSEIRDSVVYEGEQAWFMGYSSLNLIHLFSTGLRPFYIIFAFYTYFVSSNKNRWYWIFFLMTIIWLIASTIFNAARGNLLLSLIFIFSLFILFHKHISEKKKKMLRNIAIISAIPFVMFFIAVSQSRFGADAITYVNYKYAGENFINFNGLMYHNLKGTTDGNAYFPLLTKIFNPADQKYVTAGTTEKWTYIESETNVSGQYFYTFVGGLCFEFGKVGTFFIAILFSVLSYYILCVLRKPKEISMSQILFYAIGIYLFINGVFVFALQGSSGNLTIIFLILLMIYFRNNKKVEKLS
ncbi:MAG: oligosaccharide repeat unit polymerase [Prevotella sp.]|jgi:oligosaccharide repeat unit polymerase|nr:oligosaccharide repeat unit polymerase [Prevotella sp.]